MSQQNKMLSDSFFDHNALEVAPKLIGKVLRHYVDGVWLSAMIIETEAYFLNEKGSHSSLGFTEKRKALFMKPGTIYMYYARGGDSINVSCQGKGNAVLLKSGYYYENDSNLLQTFSMMEKLNPPKNKNKPRSRTNICSGQTLLCKSLGIKVEEWNQKYFDQNNLYIEDIGYSPQEIIQTTRLGIPEGRDEHLPYRFIDKDKAPYCTSNPLTKRKWQEGKEFRIISLS